VVGDCHFAELVIGRKHRCLVCVKLHILTALSFWLNIGGLFEPIFVMLVLVDPGLFLVVGIIVLIVL